ncbi:MAG: glycosyltransferase [Candidatus Omnitrophota bacterium]|nr:glycosyltransferase [Candidatus Omnitrophota bacterium]
MHILQLLPALDVGGVERGVLDLSRGLIARGHRVSVVSAGGSLVEPLIRCGAAHERMPVHDKSLITMRRCIPALARFISAAGVDLVHARSRVPAWIGYVAARAAQRSFLTTAHGFYRPHLASRVMVWGRVVIAPSAALGQHLVTRCGLPKERLRVIPRGVDLQAFAFQPPPEERRGPWRIGLIGRLSPLKGHAVALQACAELIRRGLSVKLCIAGDMPRDPMRRRLESLASALRLPDAVEWLGRRDDVVPLIASMDFLIVPSIYPESFGRSVIEAQAVGRPVVASRVGALPELIEDGRNGLLVPPGHPRLLAEAIERLIRDPALRARCVEAGRRRAEAEWDVERMVDRTLAVYQECLTKPRILLWKLSALGDVVLSTPSLRAVRRQFPEGHLALVVGRAAYEAVARCPYLNELFIYDPRGKDRGIRRQLAFLRRLRRGAFDLSVDLQNSRGTHLMAWWAGVPVRIGYRRKLGWLLNRGVRLPRVVLTPIAHQHHLLRQAGLAPDGDALELWPSPADEQAARRLLGSAETQAPAIRVGIHPGGSPRWKTKRWDLTRWARLCQALAQRHIQVVVTGGPEERPLAEALARMTQAPLLVATGRTSLMELACLIKQCQVFIAHDSATLHVAAAVGTPTVALFGPTDPARHLPSTFVGRVIKHDLFCSPCYSPRCRTITHACMRQISVEDVLQAIADCGLRIADVPITNPKSL